MRRRLWTRWVMKWAGTVLCVLLGGLWPISEWYSPAYAQYFGNGKYAIYVRSNRGEILVVYHTRNEVGISALVQQRMQLESGWRIERPGPGLLKLTRWPLHWFGLEMHSGRGARRSVIGYSRGLAVSIWVPFVAIAIPTALLWWLDRRRLSPGHCQKCGYNLTGNVSGRCPECAQPICADGEARNTNG